jgi:mRNA-degrading endonuclease RelE of RelBE toxin-antitoxin system
VRYDLIHKPTFTNQLLALPPAEIPHVLQKVAILEASPQPDAKLKKKLKGYKERIYRIRSGNYRIIYTFGEDASGNGWVALLGVDHRKDVYEGNDIVADAPAFDLASLPSNDGLLSLRDDPPPWQTTTTTTTKVASFEYLPVKFDTDLLTRLRIPAQFHPAIIACETLDDLAAADIPDPTRERLFDVAYTPNYDLVTQQPSFETGGTDDLIKYVEGELLDFLLKLDPEQERYVTWAINGAGPTLVKGSPGTGKSTIALYRVRSLLNALKASTSGSDAG